MNTGLFETAPYGHGSLAVTGDKRHSPLFVDRAKKRAPEPPGEIQPFKTRTPPAAAM